MMKKRVLTGIQPSGKLHLGNYFGTIKRMVEYQEKSDLFLVIVNLHSLTTLTDGLKMKQMTLDAAMDMLALGIDPEKSYYWVQSDVSEVTELAWILSCFTPMGLMERATSYKDKLAKGLIPNLGLFSYPVLMAADILINQADIIPVGKDQKQHMEMARDIAIKFNHQYGEVFTIPNSDIAENVAVIPGTDGQKMSKSYNNTIPIFGSDEEWKEAVMSIVTDSKRVEEPKNPSTCTVYQLYALMATEAEQQELAKRYKRGGMGYGDSKKALLNKIHDTFGAMRNKRTHYEKYPEKVEILLQKGAKRVQTVSMKTLKKVREVTGLKY
jgi:tryptophanyl-tRNA synthetase